MISEIDTLLRVHLSKFLTKCVVHFPFDPFSGPSNSGTSAGVFLEAFESITSMEVFFYSVPYVSCNFLYEPTFLWTKWLNFKVLYINSGRAMEFSTYDSNRLWRHLEKMKSIEWVVLRDPDSYPNFCEEWSRRDDSFASDVALKGQKYGIYSYH